MHPTPVLEHFVGVFGFSWLWFFCLVEFFLGGGGEVGRDVEGCPYLAPPALLSR